MLGGSVFKTILVSTVAAVCLSFVSYRYGYSNGTIETETNIEKERTEWVSKVEAVQKEFDKYKTRVESKHKTETEAYERQIKVLRDNPKIITKYITKEVRVPCGFEILHNRLVDGIPIDRMIPENYSCSREHSLSEVSEVITRNYSNCRLAMERLDALQSVVKKYMDEQKKLETEK